MEYKVGDKVRCINCTPSQYIIRGEVYTVKGVTRGGFLVLEEIKLHHEYSPARFELVQEGAVLTPEEVFEHLRKGTKLQHLNDTHGWTDVNAPEWLCYKDICNDSFRIKPEPEVIELNGKKYREIID